MLRKMSIGALAALAVSMSSMAVAQTDTQMRTWDWQNVSTDRHWGSAEWNPLMAKDMQMRYPGDSGVVWSHAMMSLMVRTSELSPFMKFIEYVRQCP